MAGLDLDSFWCWSGVWAALHAASLPCWRSALAVAWAGLPRLLPVWLHTALLGLAVLGLGVALWRGFRGFRLPGLARGLAPVWSATAAWPTGRSPISTTRRSATSIDPAATSLWQRHRARLMASIGRLDLSWPDNGLAARDPRRAAAVGPAAGRRGLLHGQRSVAAPDRPGLAAEFLRHRR